MKTLLMFKAQVDTKRFNKNQRVWVTKEYGNFCQVYFKYKGRGHYVHGLLNKENKTVRNCTFKKIEVTEEFYNKAIIRTF